MQTVSSLSIIAVLALITGLLFLILFLMYSVKRDYRKLVNLLNKTEETKQIEQIPTSEETEEKPQTTQTEETEEKQPEQITENGNKELPDQTQILVKEGDESKSTTDGSRQFFSQKHFSSSKEGLRHIVENGSKWLDEINALEIEDDTRIAMYSFVKTLIDLAKKLQQDEDFMDQVFKRYSEFIQNPGSLRVRDKKEDEALFLKNSLELSVLFRDLIRRHHLPEQYQPGKPQNINFEMLAQALTPSQISAEQHNRQYDGSDIPSNLLAYSLICNKHGIKDLNVFIAGDKIQKNIR